VRDEIVIATKSHGRDRESVLSDVETSLSKLRTDCIDVLQLHNPRELPDPDDQESAYAGALEAKEAGKVRHIGITSHRLRVALEAVDSGLYETIQFPLSCLSSEEDLELVERCREADVGFIAMKAMAGGLIRNVPANFAFLRQFREAVPIWGVQREEELDEFLGLEAGPPEFDEAMRAAVEKEREELAGDFCRGCGYCLPCPAEIPINMAARMSLLLRRAPSENFLTGEWRQRMARIENCTDCGQCEERCPYGLAVRDLLRRNLEDYRSWIGG